MDSASKAALKQHKHAIHLYSGRATEAALLLLRLPMFFIFEDYKGLTVIILRHVLSLRVDLVQKQLECFSDVCSLDGRGLNKFHVTVLLAQA